MDEVADRKVKTLVAELAQQLDDAISNMETDFRGLHAGRANSGLVENIGIESYGSTQPLKNLASISIPDPKQIVIQPWDKSILKNIEKAIQQSDLGVNPMNDGIIIRIVLPLLTEERRKDLIKIVHNYSEEAKIKVRQNRHNHHHKLKQMEKDKEISEDKLKWEEDQMDKKVIEFNKQIEELTKKKEESIMTV